MLIYCHSIVIFLVVVIIPNTNTKYNNEKSKWHIPYGGTPKNITLIIIIKNQKYDFEIFNIM